VVAVVSGIDLLASAPQASRMSAIPIAPPSTRPLMPVLAALSGAHLLNDLIQSMIPAIYPLIKETYQLDSRRSA
jgi:MFS transporter, FSR family, fosmidomycin resistance protein